MRRQDRLFWLAIVWTTFSILASAFTNANEEQVCRYCSGERCHYRAEPYADEELDDRKYAPARYVDILNLKLDVTPDFKKRTIAGTATLDFLPLGKPLSQLRLDAVHLNILDVRSTAPLADHTSTTDKLTLTFVQPLSVGERCRVEIDYTAEPRQGLYFRTVELGYPLEDTHLYTQGEPQLARYWFPCHDYPNERSSTEVICHVPKEMTVLSNGALISEKTSAANGKKAVHWRQEKPHVAYLITLVAGYFHKLENLDRSVPLAFYSQPTISEHAGNSFRDTADILDFYEKEIGVPFPWDKYYQVTVRDFGFGGMENTSMTTLAERTIFSAETENVRNGRVLDAHEMAHQWFGNYVTCKDWSHLWLNEGFATYYSRLYEGHKFGREAMLYDMYRDASQRVLTRDDDRRPIVYNQYKRPWEQFDFRNYPKASWVLHMLRSQLGGELFRRSIRTYLERHAWTSVTTPDLAKVVEEVSGRSLDRFFDQWVYHARYPSLQVKYDWLAEEQLAQVSVEQTHEVDDQVLLFEFPTTLRFHLTDRTVDHRIEINKSRHDFYVSLPEKPGIVRFDPSFTLLAEVDFEKPDKMLLAQLRSEHDLIGRLLAVKQLGERKTAEAIKALGEALANDPFFGVRVHAAKALEKIRTTAAIAHLEGAVAADDARVRIQVVESLGKWTHPRAKAALIEATKQSNPAIAATAIRGLGAYRDADAEQVVGGMLHSNSFRNELAEAALEALGKKEDPADRHVIMDTLRNRGDELTSFGLGKALRTLARVCRGLGEEATGGAEVEHFLRGYVGHTKEVVRVAAVKALGALGDARSLGLLGTLAHDRSHDRTSRAAADALEKLRSQRAAVPKELKSLRKLVDQIRDESDDLRRELDELKASNEKSGGDAK